MGRAAVEQAERAGTGGRGDEGLETFLRREHPRLVGSLSLYLGDVTAAEDLAQEALVRACREWEAVRELESPGGWTHRVAMNLAISWTRRRGAARRAGARLTARPVPPPPSPADVADAVAVREALARLDERTRRALVLRYYADLPVAEVAEAMGCPPGTVKTLTSRGIDALRRQGWEITE